MTILWYFLKPYPKLTVAIVFLSFMTSFFDGFNVVLLFSILNTMMLNLGAKTSVVGGKIGFILKIIPLNDPFIAACLLLMLSILLKNLSSYSMSVLSAQGGAKIWYNAQKNIFLKCIYADYSYFLNHKHGEIVYRGFNVPASIDSLLVYIPQILTEVLKIIIIGAVLVNISPYVCVVLVLIGTAYYYFTKQVARKISYNLGSGRMMASEKQNILLSEGVSGIRQIKVYGSENRWVGEYDKAMKEYFRLYIADRRTTPLPGHLLETLTMMSLALILIIFKVVNPTNFMYFIPVLGAFAYAFQKIMPSLMNLGNLRIQIMGILPLIELLYETLNSETRSIKDGSKEFAAFKKEIKLERLTFSYPGRKEVLKNVSISFKKGTTTAIVGASGAGKSTIADLLIRLFVPNDGKIMIDDVDLREYQISTWLSKIGFVTQDTFIFHASIKENIAFGLKASDEEVRQAAKEANAHDFIMEFPQGYETIVGDRGMKMSGGQRQRLAIARALVRKPEILLLDEATSSLDNVSEAVVQSEINQISQNRTVIMIAHRLSTIINADKIIVLEAGGVLEEGTHRELIDRKGTYWKLYNQQDNSPVINTLKELHQ
jgi:ABC-type multidrug transport system fused ATPase/permease subunit